MEDIKRTTVCQCTKCGEVFNYKEKCGKGIDSYCPHCNGKFRIIRFENEHDEHYLNKVSIQFADK